MSYEKRFVVQEWFETETTKTGFDSFGWLFRSDRMGMGDEWEIQEIFDTDKFGNPILAVAIKKYSKQPLSSDAYNSDSQKELIDLQIENKKLKERIESINEYLDNRISDSDFVIKNRKRDNLEYENIMEYKQCYQNVKEFIKNQK